MPSIGPHEVTRNAAIGFAVRRSEREFAPMVVLVDQSHRYYVWPYVDHQVPDGWTRVGHTCISGTPPQITFEYNPDYRGVVK